MKRDIGHFNKVVMADDDLDHALLFRIVLNQVDPPRELVVVNNSGELMEILRYSVPDVLFLDLNMPCKNGFDCLEEIRKDPGLKELPVVVYSSSTDLSDIKKSFEFQADLYMVKGFNSNHLKYALESILKIDWWINAVTGQRYYYMNNRFVPYTGFPVLANRL